MTDAALVTLHDSAHRVPHVRLVCISSATGTWMVATPWPSHLGAFALAVTTAQGTQWLPPPQGFTVFEVGADVGPPTRIAAIRVVLPADLEGVVATNLGVLDRAQFEQEMAQHPDPVQAMEAVAPTAFAALATPAQGVPVGLHPPTGGAPGAVVSTPPSIVQPVPRPQFPAGLCHLFGWD